MTSFRVNRTSNGRTAPPPEGPGLVHLRPGAAGPSLAAVVDFSVHPYSIGDLLVTLVGAMVEAHRVGAGRIDFCLIADPDDPPADPVMRELVTRDSRYQHLLALMPVLRLNPLPGAVHLFDVRAQALAFLDRRGAAAPAWPPRADLEGRRYLYYDILRSLHRFHAAHGGVPALDFGEGLRRWALGFQRAHAGGLLPVSVNLRVNPRFHGHRNSCLDAWRAFFSHCEGRYPVAFIVTGAAAEVDPLLRGRANVVIAKDHHTDLLQDLALVAGAAFHLGAASGPATVSQFGVRPYHVFNCDASPHLSSYGGALAPVEDGELRFGFAAPLQTIGVVPETAELILRQFERIWRARDWTVHATPGP